MKYLLFTLGVALTLAASSSAAPSLTFSTGVGAEYAWQLTGTDGNWTLSFVNTAAVVDESVPADSALIDDFVLLPDMTLSNLAAAGPDLLVATLSPTGPLVIRSNPGDAAVLTASLKTGTLVATGTTFAAYPLPADDLEVTSFDDTFGTVLPLMATADKAGQPLDLSFTGDFECGGSLVSLLQSSSGTARGVLSGQITTTPAIIPAPASLLLSSLGVTILGWLRVKRCLL